MIKVYGIRNCDSVKRTLKFLDENSLKYEFFDFKEKTISCQKINFWVEKVGIKKLFNTRSTTYRNLKLKELNLDDTEKIKWMCKENLLIKRAVLEYEDKVLVGFNKDEYMRSLL